MALFNIILCKEFLKVFDFHGHIKQRSKQKKGQGQGYFNTTLCGLDSSEFCFGQNKFGLKFWFAVQQKKKKRYRSTWL